VARKRSLERLFPFQTGELRGGDQVNERLFPARPILAVSAAVFRQGRVLVIRRARAPLLGHFSLPGGGVETGETLAAALARELMEEVAVEAEIVGFNRHVEAIYREGDRIRMHFVIASFVARWVGGEPRLSDEVDAVDWIDPVGPLPAPATPELAEVLASAARIAGQHGAQVGERAPFSLREKGRG
jgi:ADP-ribose pyrophosphatase YjhB (NUDIX family)